MEPNKTISESEEINEITEKYRSGSDNYKDNDCTYYFGLQSNNWNCIPEPILLMIFKYFNCRQLVTVSEVCWSWNRAAKDELLWRNLFLRTFKIQSNIVKQLQGKISWYNEFIRLIYHIPLVETEILKKHTNQVLHVSFSHNGKMFSTCSKDGYVVVWNNEYPATIKHQYDMKKLNWKYTQYSHFNSTDTLLLVSGLLFCAQKMSSGEIAVFQLTPEFNLQCLGNNKPYDMFGSWFNEHYFLTGELHSLSYLINTSIIWLNEVNEKSTKDEQCSMTEFCRFYNNNASYIRSLMVANCSHGKIPNVSSKELIETQDLNSDSLNLKSLSLTDSQEPEKLYPVSSRLQYSTLEGGFMNWRKLGDGFDYANSINYNELYTNCAFVTEEENDDYDDNDDDELKADYDKEKKNVEQKVTDNNQKYLIFSTGSKTYIPHQLGFKRITTIEEQKAQRNEGTRFLNTKFPIAEINWSDYQTVADAFDEIDHLIDLHGYIIGMGLSPDHRYLYVNTRPWPRGYVITDPLKPPPIAQEIDMHVIDLNLMKCVGSMLRTHKTYTPDSECFFIFLDVCDKYVASGAEDKHGYLWDRSYGICLVKFPHSDFVNSVAFNPQNSGMLVTTSDDNTIKIWRSRSLVKQLNIDESYCKRGLEVRNRGKFSQSGCNVD